MVAGKLSGFTLLFEALVLMLAQQMPFAAAARIVGVSPVPGAGDLRALRGAGAAGRPTSAAVSALAIDETSRAPRPRLHHLGGRRRGAPGAGRGRRARGQDHRRASPPSWPSTAARRANRVGQHRHVAGLHQGLRRGVAQRPHHLRQVPRRLACQRAPWTRCGASSSAPIRVPQGPALVAAEGPRQPVPRPPPISTP